MEAAGLSETLATYRSQKASVFISTAMMILNIRSLIAAYWEVLSTFAKYNMRRDGKSNQRSFYYKTGIHRIKDFLTDSQNLPLFLMKKRFVCDTGGIQSLTNSTMFRHVTWSLA